MDAETEMSQILESSDKDLKASVIFKKCFRKLLQILLKQMKKEKMSAMGVLGLQSWCLLLSCIYKLHRYQGYNSLNFLAAEPSPLFLI